MLLAGIKMAVPAGREAHVRPGRESTHRRGVRDDQRRRAERQLRARSLPGCEAGDADRSWHLHVQSSDGAEGVVGGITELRPRPSVPAVRARAGALGLAQHSSSTRIADLFRAGLR